MAASPSNNLPPALSGGGGDGFNSPRSRPSSRNPSSWSHVVRGPEPESGPTMSPAEPPVASDSDRSPSKSPDGGDAPVAEAGPAEIPDSSSSNSNDGNAPQTKKPVWNKPSNSGSETGPVMGGSWPALSESARASPKSSSDSLKALADGSASSSQGSFIPSSPHKQNSNNQNLNSTSNHAFLGRQKSNKRISGPANNGGPASSSEAMQSASDKAQVAVPDSSPRDLAHKNNNWEAGSRPHIGNDHPRARRSNGGGSYPRSDGFYSSNYGNHRRDQERPNYEWYPNRNFSGRGDAMQQQPRVPVRPFIRPPQPPISAPFITSPPIRPFASPMGFPDMPSPGYYPAPQMEHFRGMPFVTHITTPTFFFHSPDPQLRASIIYQIDYYFSAENLCKDIYLRQNMDEQGWVPISLIAEFNRVRQLTNDVSFILDALRASTVVEVMGDKIRRRGDWMNWLLSPGTPNSTALVARMQNVALEEGTAFNNSTRGSVVDTSNEVVLSRSSSGDLTISSQAVTPGGTSNQEGMSQATVRVGGGRTLTSVRTL